MNSHAEMLAVIAAHRDGKKIEARVNHHIHPGVEREWFAIYGGHVFNFENSEYRIKPEPRKAREIWLIFSDIGTVARTWVGIRPGECITEGRETALYREVIEGEGE